MSSSSNNRGRAFLNELYYNVRAGNLDISEIATEGEVKKKTVESYFDGAFPPSFEFYVAVRNYAAKKGISLPMAKGLNKRSKNSKKKTEGSSMSGNPIPVSTLIKMPGGSLLTPSDYEQLKSNGFFDKKD